MTYDVQRYDLEGYFHPSPNGAYVLASVAEAHEQAAVEAERDRIGWGAAVNQAAIAALEERRGKQEDELVVAWSRHRDRCAREAREQAIRDCISAVERWAMPKTLAAMRALLDGE